MRTFRGSGNPARTVVRRSLNSPHSTRIGSRAPAVLLATAAALVFATGCGDEGNAPAAAGASATTTPAATVTVVDPWVKSTTTGMTPAFGMLTNNTDREITVVSGSSPAAKTVELHEVAMAGGKMVMRPKAGGFVVPARSGHELKPGGDHLMLLSLTGPVKPGDQVSFTLSLADGGTVAFTAVAKDFAGGKEDYQPGGQDAPGASTGASTGGHGGMAR